MSTETVDVTGRDGSYPMALGMLGVGVEYSWMGMGQDHVSDPVLWVVNRETRSLLTLLWFVRLVVAVLEANEVPPQWLMLCLFGWEGLQEWGVTGRDMVLNRRWFVC